MNSWIRKAKKSKKNKSLSKTSRRGSFIFSRRASSPSPRINASSPSKNQPSSPEAVKTTDSPNKDSVSLSMTSSTQSPSPTSPLAISTNPPLEQSPESPIPLSTHTQKTKPNPAVNLIANTSPIDFALRSFSNPTPPSFDAENTPPTPTPTPSTSTPVSPPPKTEKETLSDPSDPSNFLLFTSSSLPKLKPKPKVKSVNGIILHHLCLHVKKKTRKYEKTILNLRDGEKPSFHFSLPNGKIFYFSLEFNIDRKIENITWRVVISRSILIKWVPVITQTFFLGSVIPGVLAKLEYETDPSYAPSGYFAKGSYLGTCTLLSGERQLITWSFYIDII